MVQLAIAWGSEAVHKRNGEGSEDIEMELGEAAFAFAKLCILALSVRSSSCMLC